MVSQLGQIFRYSSAFYINDALELILLIDTHLFSHNMKNKHFRYFIAGLKYFEMCNDRIPLF